MQQETKGALAKLTRPKLVGVITRDRLNHVLDDRLAHPTAWVTAPPGAGKTTLLSGYIESRKHAAVWYQLDSGDTDVATFFYYLGVAAQTFATRRKVEALPALTPEYLPDLLGFTRRFFRELFARLPRPALLVLDDYQEVPLGAPLHAVVACALAELPEGVRCLVASRVEPPPECARLEANQLIVTLDWEALRLTEAETAAIARIWKVTDESVIKASHQRSEGWVAGLILLLGQPTPRPAAAATLAPSSKSLFNYFAGIFANALSAETRNVLLSTAFLPTITGPLAERLSGNAQAESVLRDLHAKNYFVHRRLGTEPAYQLHALFREFLIELVNRKCTSGERLQKMRDTASALRKCGAEEDAAALFGETGDWGAAIELVLGLAPRLLMQGRWQTLQARIAALPPDEVKRRPWLQYWLGASQMAIDPLGAQKTLATAYDGFVRAQDTMGRMLAAATIIEDQFVMWSDMTSLDGWIDALEALGEGATFPDTDTEARVMAALVQALTFRAPWHGKLAEYADRLLELVQADLTASRKVMAAAVLSQHFAWLGNLTRARQACAVVGPLLAREEVLPAQKVWTLMTLAYVDYTFADHVEGDLLFARAFGITAEFGLAHVEFWMRLADCWHRLDRGEHKAVAAIIAKAEPALSMSRGLDVAHFYLVKGWLAMLEGNFVLARQELLKANALAGEAGANYTETYHVPMIAEALTELGEYAEAEEWLARVRAKFDRVGNQIFAFSALLASAYVALAQGEDGRCAALLREALAVGRTNEYVNTLNWYARMMARLCAFALEHDIEVDYVRMLISRRQLTPDEPIERWPWPVKIFALGRFEIHTSGEPVRFEGKAQRKPMELAKVLVALGGRDVPVGKLIDIMWPEPSEGDGQKSFDITVHRLRKLLGSDEAILVSDHRTTLNPKLVWVDAWSLERTLGPLIAATNAPEAQIGLLEAAAPQVLDLYRGPFLAGETEEAWQIPIRNRLAGRFQRFVLRLGEHWESRQEWRRATELYQRVVELDPLAESFCRRQMICLQAQGRRAEAIEVFRHCRQTLSLTLGVAPTSDTEAVYRQLLAS